MTIRATEYLLQRLDTGEFYEDRGWMLGVADNPNTFLRTHYANAQLNVLAPEYGVYRFADWLPVNRMLRGSSAPITYRSTGLAQALGMDNLWITFGGYWPARGVAMKTCSFKETEAYSVCGRQYGRAEEVLVVASAGNTARAFARVCSDNNIPLLLCVPEDYIDALWFDGPLNSCVKLVTTGPGSDYADAIALSEKFIRLPGFLAEGGAKNVARRDGMGTTVLSAVTTIGEIPEYYFQAVGSGTGAIAAWEANLRLIQDGRFGIRKMKLMVSQNAPFQPIYDAWHAGSRTMLPVDPETARKQTHQIQAKVLSNRTPPYGINGGLFDALTGTGGDVFTATNGEALGARKLFAETEGSDIYSAAGVALASLIRCLDDGTVPYDALVMLNVTGGGEELFKSQHEIHYLQPTHRFGMQPSEGEVLEVAEMIFS